jgi:hypothetical protein
MVMKVYDSDIRKLLYMNFTITQEFIEDPTTIVVDELDVLFGASRIDIAVINGKINGFEIKSERDNLERLTSQIEFYNKIFDTMTVVVGEKHLSQITNIIPEWWGLYYVYNDNNDLRLIRERDVKLNKNIDILSLAQLLWREELIELLNINKITKGTKSKKRYALCKLVVDSIEEKDIKHFVRKKLKSREDWRAVRLQQLCGDLR